MLNLGGALLLSALAAGAAWVAVGAAQRHRRCPTCARPYEDVGEVHPAANAPAYEVACCRACGTAHTRVHGWRSQRAWCPGCRQRTLELRARLVHAAVVDVDEACGVCGHHAARRLGDAAPAPRGRILRFPERPEEL